VQQCVHGIDGRLFQQQTWASPLSNTTILDQIMAQPQDRTPEQQAAEINSYSLQLSFGGTTKATVYFNVEADADNESWVVAEGAQLFFKGVEITDFVDGELIDNKIYEQAQDVDRQIEDAMVSAMEEYYRPYDND
jgi:hypothetical protein